MRISPPVSWFSSILISILGAAAVFWLSRFLLPNSIPGFVARLMCVALSAVAFYFLIRQNAYNIPVGSLGLITILDKRTKVLATEGSHLFPLGISASVRSVREVSHPLPTFQAITADNMPVDVKGAKVQYRPRETAKDIYNLIQSENGLLPFITSTYQAQLKELVSRYNFAALYQEDFSEGADHPLLVDAKNKFTPRGIEILDIAPPEFLPDQKILEAARELLRVQMQQQASLTQGATVGLLSAMLMRSGVSPDRAQESALVMTRFIQTPTIQTIRLDGPGSQGALPIILKKT